MLICNGRVGNDKHKGSYTCKNSSVVDYVICSPNMFEYVEDFEILEFSNLFSDAHYPLSLTLSCQQLNSHLNVTDNTCATQTERIKKWDSQKRELFVNNIDENKVEEMIDRIDENDSNIDVENIVIKILLNAASTTLGTYVYRSNAEKKIISKQSKPWFDDKCKVARKNYRCSKGQNRHHRNEYFFNKFKENERTYKKTMDDSMKTYRISLKKKLKSMSNNPKDFWKLINSGKKTRNKTNISMGTLLDFFKDLNSSKNNDSYHDDNDTDLDINNDLDDENVNEIINGPITTDEIEKAIKRLKNNKALSDDDIIMQAITK